MDRLKGKVALITGGTKGIGRAAAELFVQEGARVVVTGRDRAAGEALVSLLNRNGTEAAAYFPMDVGVWQDWMDCVAFTEKKFGKLHILINNAGISYRATVEETTPELWEEVLRTNQTGVYYGMKAGIAAMRKHGEPSAIVSTTSVDGVAGDSIFFAYCATKAAVQSMTKCAALYCGENRLNIRVNAVGPGYILTPMAYEDARQNGQTIEEYSAEYIDMHPIGHLGDPEDIAYAYLYLASDEAKFVTGATLMADGGYTAK